MAVYSGNDDHLMIDGVNCDGYWRRIKISPIQDSEENTSGTAECVERIPTLTDYMIELTIMYDDTQIDTLVPLVAPGVHTVLWGPQGNASGKPKHQQEFIFNEAPTEAVHDMSQARAFLVSGKAHKAPVYNFWKGDKF